MRPRGLASWLIIFTASCFGELGIAGAITFGLILFGVAQNPRERDGWSEMSGAADDSLCWYTVLGASGSFILLIIMAWGFNFLYWNVWLWFGAFQVVALRLLKEQAESFNGGTTANKSWSLLISTAWNSPAEVRRKGRRILAVVRHPVGGVHTHILYTYHISWRQGIGLLLSCLNRSSAPFCAELRAWEDTEVVQAPHRGRNQHKPRFWRTVRRLLKERRFAIIHSHGMQAAIPTVFANFGIDLPHVMTSQDVFCHVGLRGLTGRVKLKALERILRRLDVLIAVSEDTRRDHLEYLSGLRTGPCRVEVIPNGVDLRQYTCSNGDPSGSLHRELALDEGVYLIGFFGRFMPQKGFLVLVNALAALGRPARTGPGTW